MTHQQVPERRHIPAHTIAIHAGRAARPDKLRAPPKGLRSLSIGRFCLRATLNKSQRMRAPEIGMGCKAQNADGPGGPARLCNAADRPMSGCTRREELVQRCLKW
jgi:hypothetical protein